MVWARLTAGLLLLVGAFFSWFKSGSAIFAGQAAFAILWVLAITSGLFLVAWAFRDSVSPDSPLTTLRWFGVTAIGLTALGLFWIAPTGVHVQDEEVLASSDSVLIGSENALIELQPTGVSTGTAIVFLPSGSIDPRAYIPLLKPLAAAGHPVFIAKEPLGFAFLAKDALNKAKASAQANNYQVTNWVMAGHALGGTAAADIAAKDGTAGLILLSAKPAGNMASAKTKVISIWGSNDQIVPPAEIAGQRKNLPEGSEFIELGGGIHSYFGHYGVQAGDGQPLITREQQQELTREQITRFLGELTPGQSS